MGPGGVDVSKYAADCLDSLDLVVGDDLLVVFQCFKTIMPKVCKKIGLFLYKYFNQNQFCRVVLDSYREESNLCVLRNVWSF